jgi:hypothetical protein
MGRLKFVWAVSILLVAGIVALLAFRYGAHVQRTEENRSSAFTQAMLAFGHYKFYERIEWLLELKCYEPALTEARELKNLQVVLVSENLRRSENDPELMEYIKIRDPKFLETVVAGRLPQLRTYTTTCP